VPPYGNLTHGYMQVHTRVHGRIMVYYDLWRAALERIHRRNFSVSCLSFKKESLIKDVKSLLALGLCL